MELTCTRSIPAPRDAVWAALDDPESLRACLPGCESVTRRDDGAFDVVVAATVGPLRARFSGLLERADAKPPESCTLRFEGQGAGVGFAKGSATVTLTGDGGTTTLDYGAQAKIGGKLAQIGSRLVDQVAKKMADDFFATLTRRLTEGPAEAISIAPGANVAASSATRPASSANVAPTPGTPMVPAWWLGIAALLGALATTLGVLAVH